MTTFTYRSGLSLRPPYTIPRRQRQAQRIVRLTEAQCRMVADEIERRILKNDGFDDILIANHFLSFSGKIKKTTTPLKTGVDMLGEKEEYNEVTYELETLDLDGVYSIEGTPMKNDIQAQQILRLVQKKTIME